MDRDSPVEWTGEAHLVSRTCSLCDESFNQPETTADYQSENDIPPVCGDCHDRIDGLWSDMYIREQVQRVELMADYLEAHGFRSKARAMRDFANQYRIWESVIRAVNQSDSMSRESINSLVERYDGA